MEFKNASNATFKYTWTNRGGGKLASRSDLTQLPNKSPADQGPCLYLGPDGQRCDRRALEGGYCAKHRLGSAGLPQTTTSGRTLAAIAAAVGFLWPLISDLLRLIIRWMHSH